jgi:hypothetical protein
MGREMERFKVVLVQQLLRLRPPAKRWELRMLEPTKGFQEVRWQF